jgi:hypothetical protein
MLQMQPEHFLLLFDPKELCFALLFELHTNI